MSNKYNPSLYANIYRRGEHRVLSQHTIPSNRRVPIYRTR